MAAASLVLCSPLCFFIAKFKHSAAKPLKSVVCDFYRVEDLAGAKRVLLRDIDNIRLEINLPHIPARREGDNRVNRIVDDIFAILSCWDETLKLYIFIFIHHKGSTQSIIIIRKAQLEQQ